MPVASPAKGKRKAQSDESDLSDVPESLEDLVSAASVLVKKPKRAVVRACPVCQEHIPVRLLGQHLELELQRVGNILGSVGDLDVHRDEFSTPGAGPSTTRRSAAKARTTMTSRTPTADPAWEADKTIRAIRRRRRARHVSLREMTRDDDAQTTSSASIAANDLCPICLVIVQGDVDVVEAHVDACLAHESRTRREREEMERADRFGSEDIDVDGWEEVEDGNGEIRLRVRRANAVRGMGFDGGARQQDVDEDVDVDGEDEELFGDVQFTEGDVVTSETVQHRIPQNTEVGVPGVDDGQMLRQLVAEGKIIRTTPNDAVEGLKVKVDEMMGVTDTDKVELAVLSARRSGDCQALVTALESKVTLLESMRVMSSVSSQCRICLDPYAEPTVSTGCWHTCCRECWLRCLGSTKLCPMCKRITSATELRRIYL